MKVLCWNVPMGRTPDAPCRSWIMPKQTGAGHRRDLMPVAFTHVGSRRGPAAKPFTKRLLCLPSYTPGPTNGAARLADTWPVQIPARGLKSGLIHQRSGAAADSRHAALSLVADVCGPG
jgi:hypothetical protein